MDATTIGMPLLVLEGMSLAIEKVQEKGIEPLLHANTRRRGMVAVHKEFLTMRSGVGFVKLPDGTPFDRVDVLMKTFLRDGFMIRCAKGIEQSLTWRPNDHR
jgi:hypothetical protein